MSVELRSEPGVDTWQLILPRLMDENVEHELVDALAERPVAELFKVARRVDKRWPAGERLRPNHGLAVNVRRRRRGAQFQPAEIVVDPELAADLVGVTAIQKKFTGKTEVPVILQPQLQAVLMAQVAQSSDVIPRDPVSHQPAHIPEKPV